MTSINELKALLFDDIKDDRNKREEMKQLQTTIALYKDLISLFNIDNIEELKNNILSINIILDCIYSKKTIKAFKLEELIYGYLNTGEEKYKDKLNNLLYKFKLDALVEINKHDDLNNSLLKTEEIITSKKIISSFKYKKIISEEQKDFIKRRLEKENTDFKDIIIILERINVHNAEVRKIQGERIKYGELYYLINLLNQGYEYIELPEKRNESIDNFCDNFIETIEKTPLDKIESILESISYFNSNDLEYIYKKILLFYQNKMYDIIESLKDGECYFDNEIITIIKQEYNDIYNKYILVRNVLDKVLYKEEIIDEVKEEDKKELYFSSNNYEDPSKCWFIKDLKDIREESLDSIKRYLDELRKGASNKLKPLTGQHGYSEIRDDQIRIVFKPVGSDKVIILGVFIKKDNNDRETFNKLVGRSTELCPEEYNEQVLDYFNNYVLENARKGTRK